MGQHTVDGDSDTLSENITVGTLKGWYLIQWIDFGIFSWKGFFGSLLNEFEIKLISLRHEFDGRGPRILLEKDQLCGE